MKVKMSKTTQGSENGFQVNSYQEGEVYEVPESLGKFFVEQKFATEAGGEATKSFKESAADDALKGVDYNADVGNIVERNEADKEAGVIRPEQDRLLEIANRRTQEADPEVDEKARLEKSKKVSAAARLKDEGGEAKSTAPKSNKALKGTDYENKSAK